MLLFPAKRSSEVIFYENQRNGVDVKKRSEDWQDKEQPLSQQVSAPLVFS